MRIVIIFFVLVSCTRDRNLKIVSPKLNTVQATIGSSDTIAMSKKHKPNLVLCDLDGDNLLDSVQLVMNTNNDKYGLRIVKGGTKSISLLGMGNRFLDQNFDNLDWVESFEIVPCHSVIYENVSEDGEIISDQKVEKAKKIKLENDAFLIHYAESCGGGIIYEDKGVYKWIQQE